MNAARQTLLGIVFFVALVGLGLLTVFLRDASFLQTKHTYEIFFSEVSRLRTGDDVYVYGTKIGKVSAIDIMDTPNPSERVRITLTVSKPVTLQSDYQVYILDNSLLGGKMVEINVGVLPTQASPPFTGIALPSPLRAFQIFVEENREAVTIAVQKLAQLATNISDGQGSLGQFLTKDDFYLGLMGLMNRVDNVVKAVDEGDGSLARFIREPTVYDNVASISTNLASVFKKIDEGDGSVARLINDGTLFDEVKSAATHANSVLGKIDRGEGLIGKLSSVESDELFKNIDTFVAQAGVLATNLNQADGIFNRLVNDTALAAEFTDIVTNANRVLLDLSDVTQTIRAGGGMLGALVYDRFLRDRFVSAIDQLTGAIEDAREAAPVSSIASFIFGTF